MSKKNKMNLMGWSVYAKATSDSLRFLLSKLLYLLNYLLAAQPDEVAKQRRLASPRGFEPLFSP